VNILEIILKALENGVNLTIVIMILLLAFIDLFFKKNLKSQIVSLGVLGTFIGIFMGLQNFNPDDMKNSIDTILLGLKTAFFTSIVGMGVALVLAIVQKLLKNETDEDEIQEILLREISTKLNFLEKLDSSQNSDKIIGELERLRSVQSDAKNETKKILVSINELKENSNRENRELIDILNVNFSKMNRSLEIAIEQLSKGATEEIIKALKEVIEEFNQELQTQFGENFVKLNESVINLLQWQENYKRHIEGLEKRLTLSTLSIEKSKSSLEIISSKNEDILQVYQELHRIINTYDKQVDELNRHLQTYALLSSNAKKMFSTIQDTVSMTKDEFIGLSKTIVETNEKQRSSFRQNQAQLELISKHFKNMGTQIPHALAISLEQLNRGLTSLTTQFQKDYKEIMDKYQTGLR